MVWKDGWKTLIARRLTCNSSTALIQQIKERLSLSLSPHSSPLSHPPFTILSYLYNGKSNTGKTSYSTIIYNAAIGNNLSPRRPFTHKQLKTHGHVFSTVATHRLGAKAPANQGPGSGSGAVIRIVMTKYSVLVDQIHTEILRLQ